MFRFEANADCSDMTGVECMDTHCTGEIQTDSPTNYTYHTIPVTTAHQARIQAPPQWRDSGSFAGEKRRVGTNASSTKRDKRKISIKRSDINRVQNRPLAKKIRLLPILKKTAQVSCHIKPDTVDSVTVITLPTELVQNAPLTCERRPTVGSSSAPRVKLRGSPTEAVVRAGPTPKAFQHAMSSEGRRCRSKVPSSGTDRTLLIKCADIMQILKKH